MLMNFSRDKKTPQTGKIWSVEFLCNEDYIKSL